jgi:hypothetical protein
MPTREPNEPQKPGAESPGFETTDVNVSGVLVFLASLAAFIGVFFIFCFGMGKVINTRIQRNDGPPNRWSQTDVHPPGSKRRDLTSSSDLEQEQLNLMVKKFPTPRLQIDDGNLDIAQMHVREDLLLDHYSWVDRQGGKVRIPINRAMELIAQHGLPVAPVAQMDQQQEPLMAGDRTPAVTVPLTDGFAATAWEQEYRETLEQERTRGEKPGDQAALGAGR